MIIKAKQSGFLAIGDLLVDYSNRRANGYLKISANEVDWFIYFKDGQIFYANFSVNPLDRLELYTCQRLQHYKKTIDRSVFQKIKQQTFNLKLDDYYPSYDYQALYSLVNSKQISKVDAALIIQEISKESIRNFLLITTYEHYFTPQDRPTPILWSVDAQVLINECNNEIDDWRKLGQNFYSPYLRPYLLDNSNDVTGKYDYLRKFLIGGDFHQLSMFLDRSPLRIAQNLAPLVKDGVVGLRSPQRQYARLPKFWLNEDQPSNPSMPFLEAPRFKIVCIDDSPAILRRIQDFIDETDFEVITIQDSREALSKVIAVKPDIILTDVDMPHINGYQLSKMLRRHSTTKKTPIIMVTSNRDWISRSKASLCGVNNYITKPFTQSSLNGVIFQHLNY
jgi:two-component system, chemotaxis family, response regulator PixG